MHFMVSRLYLYWSVLKAFSLEPLNPRALEPFVDYGKFSRVKISEIFGLDASVTTRSSAVSCQTTRCTAHFS